MRKHKTGERLWRTPLVVGLDVICINLSMLIAIFVRFDFRWSSIPVDVIQDWISFCPLYILATLLIYWCMGLYRFIWHFISFTELPRILLGILIADATVLVINYLLPQHLPLGVMFMSGVLNLAFVALYRYGFRFQQFLEKLANREDAVRVMIIGAGDTGMSIIRELTSRRDRKYEVVCFIDADQEKWGRRLAGLPVVGGYDEIPDAVKQYRVREIIFAISKAPVQIRRQVLEICKDTGCKMKIVPDMYQLVNGEVKVQRVRDVDVEDLLGRDAIHINMEDVFRDLQGKVIMVTGGGGSIGSELCRQIAMHEPKKLIIVDIYENSVYDLQQYLKFHNPNLDFDVRIASVRDEKRMDMLFDQYRPEYVYHAAAHKHVPLMEDSPNEALKNNVMGTWKTAICADRYGAKRFVLISTDKAVNPTNLMGATKRLCEMVIQCMDRRSKTEFVAVRFGNVLSSNGSVVPLFKKQIAAGGPVTVTHPDIIRFFMTIPEAVSLVLEAGAFAKGGEIFVLDMGEPVKIDELARNLIRLSGYTPDVDIPIVYTGLRPGEKLYEEVLVAEEGIQKTANELIYIGNPLEIDEDRFWEQLAMLEEACERNADNIKELVAEVLPTYHLQGQKETASVS